MFDDTKFDTEWFLAKKAGYFKDIEITSQVTYKGKKGNVTHRLTVKELEKKG